MRNTANENRPAPEQSDVSFTRFCSPVGVLKLVSIGDKLAGILWENDDPRRVQFGARAREDTRPVLVETARQLGEYFSGSRTFFTIELCFIGTDFQKQVWHALTDIPFGQTRSYGQIARQLGRPNAVRAVGSANGKNPISIIAPCHRVIGASGRLIGFAGGLHVKQFLLGLESSISTRPLFVG